MTRLAVILGDQLSLDLSALRTIDRAHDIVLMMEVMAEATYVTHHKQKIVLILSAMRHFAAELADAGYRVDYVRLDDPDNSGSFAGEIERAIQRHDPPAVFVTHPGEHRVLAALQALASAVAIPIDILEDDRFLSASAEFANWADSRREMRMEFFYRHMRIATGLLMDGDKPVGGQWNYDADNRKPWPRHRPVPDRLHFPPDAITRAVIDLVERIFSNHFGTLDKFGWAVSRADALKALEAFLTHHLPWFGDYQDAMRAGAPFLHHGLISPYLNIGLLNPREVCQRAEAAYRQGLAPLNAVEGFIRQILGWREYVRGVYWHLMPGYAEGNALAADQVLPAFYWDGETDMACVRDVVGTIQRHGYAHHIQRLMVTGNLALLWGVRPAEIEAWYLAVFVDAFDWVELPNTHGMAIHADGGLMASKPYAASGAYIDRMSNYCRGCRYDPKQRHGPDACPITILYWDFLDRHAARFSAHPRMKLMMDALSRLPADTRRAIRAEAATLRRAGTDRQATPAETSLF